MLLVYLANDTLFCDNCILESSGKYTVLLQLLPRCVMIASCSFAVCASYIFKWDGITSMVVSYKVNSENYPM